MLRAKPMSMDSYKELLFALGELLGLFWLFPAIGVAASAAPCTREAVY